MGVISCSFLFCPIWINLPSINTFKSNQFLPVIPLEITIFSNASKTYNKFTFDTALHGILNVNCIHVDFMYVYHQYVDNMYSGFNKIFLKLIFISSLHHKEKAKLTLFLNNQIQVVWSTNYWLYTLHLPDIKKLKYWIHFKQTT